MIRATIITLIILVGIFTARQFFNSKSGVETSNDKPTLIFQILFGIVLILIGLFLTFGITVYSLKEQDNNGFYGFFISFGFIGFGVYNLINAIKRNKA